VIIYDNAVYALIRERRERLYVEGHIFGCHVVSCLRFIVQCAMFMGGLILCFISRNREEPRMTPRIFAMRSLTLNVRKGR